MVNNQFTNPWTEQEDQLAVSMLKEGATLQNVAGRLRNRTYNAVRHRNSRKWNIRTRFKLSEVTKEELEATKKWKGKKIPVDIFVKVA